TFRVVEQRLALPLRRRLLRPAQRDRSYYLARLRVYHLQGVEQVVGDDDPFAVRGAGEAQRPAAQRDAAQPLLQHRLLHEIAGVAAGPRDLFRVEEQQFVRAARRQRQDAAGRGERQPVRVADRVALLVERDLLQRRLRVGLQRQQ